jgi:hypothetical protein
MLRYLMVAAAAVALTGCVSTKNVPLETKQIATLQGGTMTVSQRAKPDFSAMTAGKATFGLIGAAAMISAGNKIVADNAIEDPANYIAQKLAADLAGAHALNVVDTGGVQADGGDVKKLAAQYAKADLLLDVQTVNWSFVYFPTDWNNYRVIYSTKLRLIDTKRSKLLAEGFCARVPDQSPQSPTHDELLADGAARLKKELATHADYCVDELRRNVLTKT